VRKRVGVAVTCATILLSAFIISIVYSAQNVVFGLTQNVKAEWKDGNITLSIPFYVRNYGVYDIQDVNIVLELRDSTGQVLTKTVNYIGTIKAGSALGNYINITFQPISLLLQVLLNRVFHNRTLELHAAASLSYALSLIALEAEASIPLTPQVMAKEMFESLVKEVSLKSKAIDAQITNEIIRFTLPFSINYTGRFKIENFELNLVAKNSTGHVLGFLEIVLHELRSGENTGLLNITLDRVLTTKGFALIDMFTIRLRGKINNFGFEWAKDLVYSHAEW